VETPTKQRHTVTRLEVVKAAREILDVDGFDGLTMAHVARRVGFSTMAVYRHVESRDELIAAAMEMVLADIQPDVDGSEWLAGVIAWMNDVRRCLLSHPWAATQLGTRHGGASAPWQRVVDVLASYLHHSPLTPHDQARALVWTSRLTIGTLILEIGSPMAGPRRRRKAGGSLTTELASLRDDDLWRDVVDQTESFLSSIDAPVE
jgi:AcrR family transcriptional regulator